MAAGILDQKPFEIQKHMKTLFAYLFLFASLNSCKEDDSAPASRQWSKLTSGTTQAIVTAFVDDNVGLIAEKNIYRTTDGGTTWTKVFNSVGKEFSDIDFVDPNNAYAVGDGIVYKTVDGGVSWASVTPPEVNQMYWDADFVSATTGFLAEGSGKIYKTTDGGATWTNPGSITSPPLVCIQFVNSNLGFASGGQGNIKKTTDGGSTWTTIPYVSAEVVGVRFSNASTGFAFEHDGKIKKTTDGGTTWTAQTSGLIVAVRALTLVNAEIGFAVGDNGSIISTTDGGTTWKTESSGTTALLNSVQVTNSKVYAAGFNGVLLKAER